MLIARHRIDGSAAKLPRTMAGLLETAIKDARSLDRSIYFPNYDDWHNPDESKYCMVCLAGCIIAGQLQVQPSDRITSMSFDEDTENLLDALDNIREGYWCRAFVLVYGFNPPYNIISMLHTLPPPLSSEFYGWNELERHLDSLQSTLPELRAIDRAAARHQKSILA